MKTIAIVFAVLFVLKVLSWSPIGRDNSDQTGWFAQRSGLSIYTDYGTGVQYVKGGLFGAAEVRVDKDGFPINIYK